MYLHLDHEALVAMHPAAATSDCTVELGHLFQVVQQHERVLKYKVEYVHSYLTYTYVYVHFSRS